MVRDADLGQRDGDLALAVSSQLPGREVRPVGYEDLAQLAQGAGDERHLGALGDVARHGRGGLARLVVGVGMDKQEASVG